MMAEMERRKLRLEVIDITAEIGKEPIVANLVTRLD